MPRYLYHCQVCDKKFDVNHSITVKYKECTEIEPSGSCSGELIRVPSFSSVIKKSNFTKSKKVGQVTDDYIKDAQAELKKQKNKLRGQEYK